MQNKRRLAVAALFSIFLLIQLIPYGRNHTNPPVVQEPTWDSDETRELVEAACFDCHSNETEWPWYSHVAPISWAIQSDVEEGRTHLNFSEWGMGDRHEDPDDFHKVIVIEEEMPHSMYVLLHSEADLSDHERVELVEGLSTTIELTGPSEGSGGHGHGTDASDTHGHHNDDTPMATAEPGGHGHDDDVDGHDH